MDRIGFTKARSMGPVADGVERAGGSVSRVFRRADLPMHLIDQPDRLILLRDQLRLVDCAAREVGDDAFPARLSTGAGILALGTFGRRISVAAQLDAAITRCNDGMGSVLQSMTRLDLVRGAITARWTYQIVDRAEIGRQKNEMLALGYMIDLLRRFCRAGVSVRAELPGSLAGRREVEAVLGCDVTQGGVAALVFPVDCLRADNPVARSETGDGDVTELPDPADLGASVAQLISLGLLDRHADLAGVSRRLKLSPRSLQRQLAADRTSFDAIKQRVLQTQACASLRSPDRPITDIAYDLGYADPAHFTRAFARWTGLTPRSWRQRAMGS